MPPTTQPASLFIAVGHMGQRLVSEDGTNWKPPQLGKEGEVYRAICYGSGRFVAVGSYGGKNIFATTADGVNWQTAFKDGQYKYHIGGVGFGNAMFMGVGGDPGSAGASSPMVTLSPDGATWTNFINIGGKNILRRVAYGNGLFVGVGDRGRRAASKDGRQWTDAADVKPIDTLIDIAYGNGVFVGVGLNALRLTTRDGVKWSPRLVGDEGEHLNSIVWTGERFVAVGMGVTYISWDGAKWDRQENKDAPLTMAYGKKLFVGANWKGRVLTSSDAIKWTQVFKAENHIEAVAFAG